MLPDGRIVSGSDDKTVRIWSPATGACHRSGSAAEAIIVLIGRTGDGKSAFSNLMASIIGEESDHEVFGKSGEIVRRKSDIKRIAPFFESSGSDSHKLLPSSLTASGFRMIDIPG